jgi:short-chain fatty acids transporter
MTRTAEDLGVRFDPPSAACAAPSTPGERLEHSSLLGVAVALLGVAWLVTQFAEKGGLAGLDLNTYNACFLFLGLLLHRRPRSFLKAVTGAVPATGGVLIQFPFYGGVLGIITADALSGTLASIFTAASTPRSFPLLIATYSAVLGLFVPSGGGKWVIEAPYVLTAAATHGINLGWVVQIYNAAEALPNLINPFWMLPLMGILNVRAWELAGFSILQLLVNLPLVFLLCWALSYTF